MYQIPVVLHLVGEDGFEPSKRRRNRFTVCPLWPLGNSPIFNYKMELADGFEPPTCWLQINNSNRISCTHPAYYFIQVIKERSNNITDVIRFVKQINEAFFWEGNSARQKGTTQCRPPCRTKEKYRQKAALHTLCKAAFSLSGSYAISPMRSPAWGFSYTATRGARYCAVAPFLLLCSRKNSLLEKEKVIIASNLTPAGSYTSILVLLCILLSTW